MRQPTFHERLRNAIATNDTNLVHRSYESETYCTPAMDGYGNKIPERRWHVSHAFDMPNRYRWEGDCSCVACEVCGSVKDVSRRSSSLGEVFQCDACVQKATDAYLKDGTIL